jgi:hypothetical protein
MNPLSQNVPNVPTLETQFPEYTRALVSFARGYDRARLATGATEWLFNFRRGTDDDFSKSVIGEFAEERLQLLSAQLQPMGDALADMVIAQSRPHLEIVRDASGALIFPPCVHAMMECIEMPTFFYDGEADALAKGQAYRDTHYLILWADDCHLLPKRYPRAFVEVWWSLWWRDAVALVEQPDYGWTVCHNEL